jgi:hypothetical protein
MCILSSSNDTTHALGVNLTLYKKEPSLKTWFVSKYKLHINVSLRRKHVSNVMHGDKQPENFSL